MTTRKRCKHPSCEKYDKGGGLCKVHGGGKRCSHPGCEKSDQGGGFCTAHGGGKRCTHPSCEKGDQGGGFCSAHGGGSDAAAAAATAAAATAVAAAAVAASHLAMYGAEGPPLPQSQYRGVFWAKERKRWSAQCCGQKRGYFKVEEVAARAYNSEARYLGHYERLNVIHGDPPHVIPEREAAGADTRPLSQLNLSKCVPESTQIIPLIHSEMLKLS